MTTLLIILIPLGLIATATALGLGIYALARGGAFSKKNANKLMWLRVELQAITIGILMLFTWLINSGGA